MAARDCLDDVPAVLKLGDAHDARGISDAGVDRTIDRDLRVANGHRVPSFAEAEHDRARVLRVRVTRREQHSDGGRGEIERVSDLHGEKR